MVLMFLLFFLDGILLTLTAIPLLRGKVKPNPWYGFRTRATLENPEIWYPANRYLARWLLWIGALATFWSVVTLLPTSRFEGDAAVAVYATLNALFVLPALTLGIWRSMVYLGQLKP